MNIYQKKEETSGVSHFLLMFSVADRMEDNKSGSKKNKLKALMKDRDERAFYSDVIASSITKLYQSKLLNNLDRFYDLLSGVIEMRYTRITTGAVSKGRTGVAIIFGAAEQSIRNNRVHALCTIIKNSEIDISEVILSGARPPAENCLAECSDESQAMYVEMVKTLRDCDGYNVSEKRVDEKTTKLTISHAQDEASRSINVHKECQSINTSQNIANSLTDIKGICNGDMNLLLISSMLHLFRISGEFEKELGKHGNMKERIQNNIFLVASDDKLEAISNDDQADLVYLKTMLWEVYYNLVLSEFNPEMATEEDRAEKSKQFDSLLRDFFEVKDSQIVKQIRRERQTPEEIEKTVWGEKHCQRMLAQCFSSFVYDKKEKSKPRRIVNARNKADGIAVTHNSFLNDTELTEMFLSCYYQKPKLESGVGEETDLISALFDQNNEFNSVYIYSGAGDGKSIFLSRFNQELNTQGKYSSIVFDTEEFRNNREYAVKGRSEIGNFWAYVYHKIREHINGAAEQDIEIGRTEADIVNYVKGYDSEHDNTIILVFDNLDAFHYNVERHLFGDPQHRGKKQFDDEKMKVLEIVRTIVGCIKKCKKVKAIFSLRDYSLSLLNNSIHIPNENRLRLVPPDSITVLTRRMEMLRDITNAVIPIGFRNDTAINTPITIMKGTKDAFNTYFDTFFSPQDEKKSPHDIYQGLHELSSQGWRSVVKLLNRHIVFEVEKAGDGAERLSSDMRAFFTGDIRLLFILDMFNRYSQVLSDKTLQSDRITFFPNMFLIRALQSDDICHEKPIYFLKLLVLLLVDGRKETGATEEDVYSVLCPSSGGGYEKGIVQLVLGSLAATNESNCLNVDFAHESPLITLTSRGKALLQVIHRMRGQKGYSIPYCFHFECLQFFCDDYYILKPTTAAINDLVKNSKVRAHLVAIDRDYSYLGHEGGEIRAKAKSDLLEQKAYRTLFFTYLLEAAHKHEMKMYPNAWEKVRTTCIDGCEITNEYFRYLFVADGSRSFWRGIRSEIVSTYNVFAQDNKTLDVESVLSLFDSSRFDAFFGKLYSRIRDQK